MTRLAWELNGFRRKHRSELHTQLQSLHHSSFKETRFQGQGGAKNHTLTSCMDRFANPCVTPRFGSHLSSEASEQHDTIRRVAKPLRRHAQSEVGWQLFLGKPRRRVGDEPDLWAVSDSVSVAGLWAGEHASLTPRQSHLGRCQGGLPTQAQLLAPALPPTASPAGAWAPAPAEPLALAAADWPAARPWR